MQPAKKAKIDQRRRRLALAPDEKAEKDRSGGGAGDEGELMGLSGGDQAFVDSCELVVPTEGGGQGRDIEAFAQALTTALDMSHTNLIAAIVVVGSKAGESGGLFTREAADLGHAHQNGDGGSQTDAVDAGDQIEPLAVFRQAGRVPYREFSHLLFGPAAAYLQVARFVERQEVR